jgi:hypothetical protein
MWDPAEADASCISSVELRSPVVDPDVRLRPDARAARHTAQWVPERFGDPNVRARR